MSDLFDAEEFEGKVEAFREQWKEFYRVLLDEIVSDKSIYDHWNSTLEFMAGNSPTWEKRNEQ